MRLFLWNCFEFFATVHKKLQKPASTYKKTVVGFMPLTFATHGLTDPGHFRKTNEDVWECVPEHDLFLLADGMGGHQAGEVAARETVSFISCRLSSYFSSVKEAKISHEELKQGVKASIQAANQHVFELGQSHQLLKGMGTTLCCLYFFGDQIVYAHVGDSRIYRLRNGRIEQLTKDHSLIRELVDIGQISEKEAQDFSCKNIITRAIGTDPTVEPTVCISEVFVDDYYLLCSDGLSDLLSGPEIEHILNQSLTVEEKTRTLIASAKKKGGYDNITVVLVGVNESYAKMDIS